MALVEVLNSVRPVTVAPFVPTVRLSVIPSALALLPQIGGYLLRKAQLRVCQVANDNMRKTLEKHTEACHRETVRREKCHQSYSRTIPRQSQHK